MALASGARLGPYEIVEPLGASYWESAEVGPDRSNCPSPSVSWVGGPARPLRALNARQIRSWAAPCS
jgi:hypothetical protein